jgi:hypothetical protein
MKSPAADRLPGMIERRDESAVAPVIVWWMDLSSRSTHRRLQGVEQSTSSTDGQPSDCRELQQQTKHLVSLTSKGIVAATHGLLSAAPCLGARREFVDLKRGRIQMKGDGWR